MVWEAETRKKLESAIEVVNDCFDALCKAETRDIDSNEYSNKLISNNALSYLEEPEISIYYTYDSNTLEIFAVGLGTVKNIVNMASLNEDSFSRLVKNMIDSMV